MNLSKHRHLRLVPSLPPERPRKARKPRPKRPRVRKQMPGQQELALLWHDQQQLRAGGDAS